MNSPIVTKSFTAEAAIAACRIVAIGAADGGALQASAATDALIGVSTDLAADSAARVDVHMGGPVDVEYGGVVARGDLLTADADGKAVAAAPAAGVNNRIVGVALVSGVAGDIGSALLSQGIMQGA